MAYVRTKKCTDSAYSPGNSTHARVDIDGAIQEVYDMLLRTNAGDTGADNINCTTPAGLTGTTLQSILNSIASLGVGVLPGDGTITDAKLSNAAGQIKSQLADMPHHINITGQEQGPVMNLNNGANPNYIEFSKDGYNVKGSVGALGNYEVNLSYNMDYKTGVHKYYDSTKAAYWFAMNDTGTYLQYAPANYAGGNPDIWYGTGMMYAWRILSDGTEVLGGSLTVGENKTVSIIQSSDLKNLIINTQESMLYNIDSDNNQTTKQFIWGTNRTGDASSGGSTLMVLSENAILSLFGVGTGYIGIEQDSSITGENFVIRTPTSMLFNIDYDNNDTGKVFVWGTNRKDDIAQGTTLMMLNESGWLGVNNGNNAITSPLQIGSLPVYVNNAAAITGGLTAGAFYRTGADPDHICVVH